MWEGKKKERMYFILLVVGIYAIIFRWGEKIKSLLFEKTIGTKYDVFHFFQRVILE